jgi:SAM-dependent methyltransferase
MRNANSPSRWPNDYDRVFECHVAARSHDIGVRDVIEWAHGLPLGSTILDLGCGHGVPLAQALVNAGFDVFGIDSSPRMITAFRANVPAAHAEVAAIEDSDWFGMAFDGIVAWGVLFFLAPAAQEAVIAKVAKALKPHGRFLFTAPRPPVAWEDTINGVTFPCVSLGASSYAHLLNEHGLSLISEHTDKAENDYYISEKTDMGGQC